MSLVSVAMPVHRADTSFNAACACILHQTHADLELLIILNGADAHTHDMARAVEASDPRVRILTLPEANLAAALNHALAEARAPMLARMDADDLCPPHRLESQLATFDPNLAAMGSAWELLSNTGQRLAIHRPPLDPLECRWRLLLANPFAHGSMLMRVSAIKALGGYNTTFRRAQDYELWLRLAHRGLIAGSADVLYSHHTRGLSSINSSADQAAFATKAMLAAWSSLPPGDFAAIEPILAHALAPESSSDGPSLGLARLEALLRDQGPTRALLEAYLWLHHVKPSMGRQAAAICRNTHIAARARDLARQGITNLYLWGAGVHTEQVLPILTAHGLTIRGLIDDTADTATPRLGLRVSRPDKLANGDDVLLSSDTFEDRIWAASAPQRAKGVRVHRLYA